MLRVFLFLVLVTVATCTKAKESVHLQWSLCDPHPKIVLEKLGHKGSKPYKENPVTYYDTEMPRYTENGVMFRTKMSKRTMISKRQKISSVKVRFDEDETAIRDKAHCVWDQYGNSTFYTCERRSPLHRKSLWSDDQVAFVEQFQRVAWADLVPFGPYQNPKWKLRIKGFKAVFDDVKALPHHLMEIEMKVPRKEGKDAYRMITEHLQRHDVMLCDKQEARTLRLFRAMGLLVGADQTPLDESSHSSLPG
ncbi:hypothetical protein P152DRAFT_494329 [Eremomyces bilateralis CBS 781.70]|uniref:CYTH domain-containing protein n=1 Tax=Eremomyces bilateralis CBS 781.70 TaxID=1392243 RepID=A0A6G1FUM8_9PEZI|nr:uncharacterized protein P152DRAFT_494329 [Eremomyces bilateralis CBS 781.70]KAF1809460.1 hypothetical protein P152DRAFT_494329 [Eremomyces bilateralis CBS 781.70]